MGAHADDQRRADLIAQIHAAFGNVTREGGMSWSDSWASDGGPASDCPLFPDSDRHWQALIDDARWDPSFSWGGFSFLDAIGARYYLPAALVRCVRDGQDCSIAFHLSSSMHKSGRLDRDPRWKLLGDQHWQCISAVAEFMAALSFSSDDDESFDEWSIIIQNVRSTLERRP